MVDPRAGRIPDLGSMATVEELTPSLVRILAPNGSAMTLDGTNSYLIGSDGGGALVVDPGPNLIEHGNLIEREAGIRGWQIGGILLTHHHSDHSEMAFDFAERLSVGVYAHADSFRLKQYHHLSLSGDTEVAGVNLSVIPTPGHSRDHLSFLLRDGTLLTGDHVLGRGTSVVAYPDGSLTDYMESLERVLDQEFLRLAPGHGPSFDRGLALETVAYYIAHRRDRLDQITDLITRSPGISEGEIVDSIYSDLPTPTIRFAAEASTKAGLEFLISKGVVVAGVGGERVFSIPSDRSSASPGY